MRQIVLMAFIVVICGCNQNSRKQTSLSAVTMKPLRYGMVTGIKPDKIDYYRKLHAKPWPEVLAKVEESNIRNYSIYLQKIGADYFLFSYFEYVGKNFDEDMKKMAADTTTQRWWKETDACQLPFPEALKEHKVWTGMDEVFHLE
jgi:L-rhamnose mutarotase